MRGSDHVTKVRQECDKHSAKGRFGHSDHACSPLTKAHLHTHIILITNFVSRDTASSGGRTAHSLFSILVARTFFFVLFVDSPGRNRSLKEVVMGSSATSHPG
jgi:hypothetical protein